MMIPVRCFTCGTVIGEHWEEFTERAASHEGDEDPEAVLDDLGLNRHCCRRMFVAHTDLVDVVSPYQ
ncbi:MAG: DNA-directed RNA polymerase subunit N [Halobacteriales archaeon]